MSDSAPRGGTLDPHAAANGGASDGHAAGRGEDTDHYLDAPHAFDVTVRVADASTGLAIAGASVVLEALPAVQPPAHTQRGSQPFTVQVHSAVTDDAGTSSIVSEWSRDSGDVLRVRVDASGYQSAVQSLPSSMGKVHFVDVNLHHPSSTNAPRRSRTGSASPQKSRPHGGQRRRRARASTGGLRGSTRRGRAARGGRTRRGGRRVGASHRTRPHTSDGTKRPAGFSSDLRSFANEQLARTSMGRGARNSTSSSVRGGKGGGGGGAKAKGTKPRPLTPHQPRIKKEKYITPGPGAFDPDLIKHQKRAAPAYTFSRSHLLGQDNSRPNSGTGSALFSPLKSARSSRGGTGFGASTGASQYDLMVDVQLSDDDAQLDDSDDDTPHRGSPSKRRVRTPMARHTSRVSARGSMRSRRHTDAAGGASTVSAQARPTTAPSGTRDTVLTEGTNEAPGVGKYHVEGHITAFGKVKVSSRKNTPSATFGTAKKDAVASMYVDAAVMQSPPPSYVIAKAKAGHGTPGVGDYNLPDNPNLKRTTSVGFTRAPRYDEPDRYRTGATSTQQASSQGKNGLRRSVSRRTMAEAKPTTPGPTDYNWDVAKDKAKLKHGPASSFNKASRFKWLDKKHSKQQMVRQQAQATEGELQVDTQPHSDGDGVFDVRLSRHKSSPAFSISRTTRLSDAPAEPDDRQFLDPDAGLDTKSKRGRVTRGSKGYTIPKATPATSFDASKSPKTPGPSDYNSWEEKSLGTQQMKSTHRRTPQALFHRPKSKHKFPPGSMRAIFDGADEVVRRMEREAKGGHTSDDGEEHTPGPTDHCVDMGMGKKQLLSGKRGAASARFGAEPRGFGKLYTAKWDASGKGDINKTAATAARVPAPWDYNPSPTGKAAKRAPSFTFAGGKTTRSRKAIREELQQQVAAGVARRKRRAKSAGRSRVSSAQHRRAGDQAAAASARSPGKAARASLARPESRARIIDPMLSRHRVNPVTGPGSYNTYTADSFGGRNVSARRSNAPAAVFATTSRQRSAKVVAPDSHPQSDVDTPGPGAYIGADGKGLGAKQVLSKSKGVPTARIPKYGRERPVPLAPGVKPTSSTVPTPGPGDYEPHAAALNSSSRHKQAPRFQFGTSARGTVEVEVG